MYSIVIPLTTKGKACVETETETLAVRRSTDRTFLVAAWRTWNILPSSVRPVTSLITRHFCKFCLTVFSVVGSFWQTFVKWLLTDGYNSALCGTVHRSQETTASKLPLNNRIKTRSLSRGRYLYMLLNIFYNLPLPYCVF